MFGNIHTSFNFDPTAQSGQQPNDGGDQSNSNNSSQVTPWYQLSQWNGHSEVAPLEIPGANQFLQNQGNSNPPSQVILQFPNWPQGGTTTTSSDSSSSPVYGPFAYSSEYQQTPSEQFSQYTPNKRHSAPELYDYRPQPFDNSGHGCGWPPQNNTGTPYCLVSRYPSNGMCPEKFLLDNHKTGRDMIKYLSTSKRVHVNSLRIEDSGIIMELNGSCLDQPLEPFKRYYYVDLAEDRRNKQQEETQNIFAQQRAEEVRRNEALRIESEQKQSQIDPMVKELACRGFNLATPNYTPFLFMEPTGYDFCLTRGEKLSVRTKTTANQTEDLKFRSLWFRAGAKLGFSSGFGGGGHGSGGVGRDRMVFNKSREVSAYLIQKCCQGTLRWKKITPTMEVLDELQKLLFLMEQQNHSTHYEIKNFINRYGTHICTLAELGGLILGKSNSKFYSTEEAKRWAAKFATGVNGILPYLSGKIGVDTGIDRGHSNASHSADSGADWQFYGGDQGTYSPFNSQGWLTSLKDTKNYAIIERIECLRMDEFFTNEQLVDLKQLSNRRVDIVNLFRWFFTGRVQPRPGQVRVWRWKCGAGWTDYPAETNRVINEKYEQMLNHIGPNVVSLAIPMKNGALSHMTFDFHTMKQTNPHTGSKRAITYLAH